MYRFGDGTPFPLRENFIETLVAAIDCCVAIYQIEARIEENEARVREARRRAVDEQRRLDALHSLLENALAPLLANKEHRTGRASEQAAARIFESATSIIKNSRAGVARRRETAEHEIVPAEVKAGVAAALGQFFCRHQLPRTEWNARWQASGDEPAAAEISAHATRELELLFRAAPIEGFWARPVAMADLFKGPVTAQVANGSRTRSIRLDPTVLTEVHAGAGREAMVLRESTKRPAAGLHILMPRSGEAGPLVVQLDKHDQSRGQPFYLDEASAGAVLGAWRAIERELPDLVTCRDQLTAARLSGRDVSEIEHPGQLAELILMAIAPLVREMRMRSRVPGELILKRDLAADRREEMFVPRQALWDKLSELSPRHRQLFEAMGLNNEATFDFVTRVTRVSQKPARTRAPVGTGPAPMEAVDQPELPTLESYGFERDPDLIESSRVRPTPSTEAEATVAEPPADEGVSEVELTNPRGKDSEVSEVSEVSVVSGIIDRASA
jgi:hypothetical protein